MRALTIILLLTSKFVFSQSYLESDYQIGLLNTSINAQHILDGSGFLNNEFKEQFINDLQTDNTIFLFQEYGLKYRNSNGWTVGLKNSILGKAQFPKELVQLGLYGNGQLLGQELSLSPMSAEIVHFTKLFYEQEINQNFSTSIALVVGHQFANLEVKKGLFNTAELGTSIDYDLELEAQFSDTSDIRIFSLDGVGFAFGADYKKEIENGKFSIAVSDLGIIKWNNKTSNFNLNSQYSFDGIEINDIDDFNDSLLTNELDQIEEDLKGNTSQNYYHYRLPFRLSAYLSQNLDYDVVNEATFRVDYINNFYPFPRWSLQVHKDLKKHRLSLGYHLGGAEYPGFEFEYRFSGFRNQIRLYTKQANYFNPESAYGIHFGIGLRKILKPKQEKKENDK
jgi:hypothetical protein